MLEANKKVQKIDLSIRSKWIVKFYNTLCDEDVSNIEEIPAEKLEFILSIPYHGIVAPFILNKIKKGYGYRSIADVFNIGTGYAYANCK